jgi:excisionase family DNA binding protein
MDTEQLAEYLGISKWLVYKYVKNREIPFIPFGRLVRFDRIAVDKWAARRMVQGPKAAARGAGSSATEQDTAEIIRPGNELDRKLAGEPS